MMSKAEILEEAKRRAAGTEPPLNYTINDVTVRYSGDNSMILTDYTVKRTEQGREVAERRHEIMLVSKQGGGWKALTSRYTVGDK
jgi:ketosteroid isomerase-like protein